MFVCFNVFFYMQKRFPKKGISSLSYALGGNIIFLFDLQDSSWTPNIKFFYVKGRMGTIRETDPELRVSDP